MGIEEFLLEEAEKRAFAESFKIGFAEGIKQSNRQVAFKLKKHGSDIAYITNITGLSAAEINNLSLTPDEMMRWA